MRYKGTLPTASDAGAGAHDMQNLTETFIFLLAAALAVAVALVGHGVAMAALGRVVRRSKAGADDAAVGRLRRPARWFLVAAALQLVVGLPGTGPPEVLVPAVRALSAMVWPPVLAWLVLGGVFALEEFFLARFDLSARDNLRARKMHTQVRVFNRILVVVAGILALGAVLMGFETFRRLGTGLLASAGLAGIVVGLAAQKTIGNILAGVQLAFTQPIRLDDVVIVEGEWGRIEEITFTYVVVRIWDLRRLVVPVSYFMEKPFQNWTRVNAELMGTVFLYCDWTVPVDAVRAELERVCKDHALWDGKVCGLQVTNTDARSVELRALVSASDASRLWDLRCAVREALLTWLQRNHPGALPRVRAELDRPPGPGDAEE